MLQTMREKLQGIIAITIVGLVSITFVLWGINYYLQSRGGDNVVAKVNGYIGGEITGTVDAYDNVDVAGLEPATVDSLVTMHDNSRVGLQDGSVFSGGIVFNNSSLGVGDFTGNATFNDSSECRCEATGDCVFNDNSELVFYANIIGDTEFYDTARCSGTVTGNGTFYNARFVTMRGCAPCFFLLRGAGFIYNYRLFLREKPEARFSGWFYGGFVRMDQE